MNHASGYIIEKYNNMNDAYTSSRFIHEAGVQGILLDIIGVADTHIVNGKIHNTSKELNKREFALIRHKEGHIKNEISNLCDKQYNSATDIITYADKYYQQRDFNFKSIKKPNYLMGCLQINYLDISRHLGKSFVAKGLRASQGKEVYLINCKDDYEKLRHKFDKDEKEFLFQEYIRESSGTDLRVFILKGEAIACIKRTSTKSFRANYALGSKVTRHPIDENIKAAARELYLMTDIYYIGLDLLFGKDGYYFCEINVTPGIEGSEKATGVNIAKAVIDSIKKDIALCE